MTQNWGDWRELPPRPPRPTREDDDSDDEAPPYAGPIRQPSRAPLENAVLAERLPDYVDAWPRLRGPDDPGHTFDGASNPHVADADERMRYDRVLLRGLVPESIEMLGTRAASEGKQEPLVPSDHYGLSCAVGISQRSE